MRINALRLVMFVVVGAPFSFEEEDVEVEVLVSREQMVDESDFDIFNRVGKGAIFTIFTLLYFGRELMAEFSFIFVLVIQPFNSVVSPSAFILLRTLLSFREFAQFRSI